MIGGVSFAAADSRNVSGDTNSYNTYSRLYVNAAEGNLFPGSAYKGKRGDIKSSATTKGTIGKGAISQPAMPGKINQYTAS